MGTLKEIFGCEEFPKFIDEPIRKKGSCDCCGRQYYEDTGEPCSSLELCYSLRIGINIYAGLDDVCNECKIRIERKIELRKFYKKIAKEKAEKEKEIIKRLSEKLELESDDLEWLINKLRGE